MKKIFLTVAGLLALLHSFSQNSSSDTGYRNRKLKVEEINFVSSYYHQDGNNSAVTGGIGSEKLTDFSNSIDIKLMKYDKRMRKQNFIFELGIDYYTSASSDKVDLKANSSASYSDARVYPSFTWSRENEKKGTTISAGASISKEFDYLSFGGNVSFAQKTKNRMGEFMAKFQTYIDQVTLIAPIELRSNGGYNYDGEEGDDDYGTSSRNTFAGSISYSQIINERLQIMFLADVVQQTGYLSLPFHRVYFTDGSVHQEYLPDNRFKVPLGFRANYFLGDRFVIRTYYRYYTDNWGLDAHTANIEIPVKISPVFSISPFYRYYKQTAIKYFAPYKEHTVNNQYYTSNHDLSEFNSQFIGAGIHLTPANGLLGIKSINTLELRYGHYFKSINMNADIVSLYVKFK